MGDTAALVARAEAWIAERVQSDSCHECRWVWHPGAEPWHRPGCSVLLLRDLLQAVAALPPPSEGDAYVEAFRLSRASYETAEQHATWLKDYISSLEAKLAALPVEGPAPQEADITRAIEAVKARSAQTTIESLEVLYGLHLRSPTTRQLSDGYVISEAEFGYLLGLEVKEQALAARCRTLEQENERLRQTLNRAGEPPEKTKRRLRALADSLAPGARVPRQTTEPKDDQSRVDGQ